MVAAGIDVFAYLDYRAFLRDYYLARKATARGFSYRSFSRRAGLKSPNYLKLVVDGARNLSTDMAERFGAACGLSDDEQRYFKDLVAFCQASSSADRNRHYARLTSSKRSRSVHELEGAMTSLSICVGEAGLRSLQERVQRFRSELLELSAQEPHPERVLQVSFALFPLAGSHAEDSR
jgi:hypothetical protein